VTITSTILSVVSENGESVQTVASVMPTVGGEEVLGERVMIHQAWAR